MPSPHEAREARSGTHFWLWFVLLDPVASTLFVAPIFLWVIGPARYHRYILAGAGGVFVCLVLPAMGIAFLRWRARRATEVARDLVWRRGLAAETFVARAAVYLGSCGWRVGERSVSATGRPVLTLSRDRDRWALVFARPGEAVEAELLQAAREIATASGVQQAAVVVQRGRPRARNVVRDSRGVEIVAQDQLLWRLAREL